MAYWYLVKHDAQSALNKCLDACKKKQTHIQIHSLKCISVFFRKRQNVRVMGKNRKVRALAPPARNRSPVMISSAINLIRSADERLHAQVARIGVAEVGLKDPPTPTGAPEWLPEKRSHYRRARNRKEERYRAQCCMGACVEEINGNYP